MEIKEQKRVIRQFMREHYSDESLAMLLAHAQSGKLAFNSCCCFIGVSNAPHALLGDAQRSPDNNLHHRTLQSVVGALAYDAETAYSELPSRSNNPKELTTKERDAVRRRILIPMVRAEIKRRDNLKRDAFRQHNGDTITNLCKLGDEILAAYLPKDWTKERWIRAMAEHRGEGE